MSWIDKAFGTHPQALIIRSERSALLAANIANADTPGYKARDIDFAETLRRIETGTGSVGLRASSSGHIAPSEQSPIGESMYRVPTRAASNGNTVESEVEQAAFADNALRYQSSLEFLNGTIAGLKMAFRGE